MAQMGNPVDKEVVEAPAPITVTGNGDLVSKPGSSGRSGGADQCESQRKEQSMCSPVGPREDNVLRPSRPTCFTGDMAVQWEACGGEATRQSTWRLGQLRSLCPPPVVPAKEGISFQPHRGQQCGDGSEGP